MGCIIEALFTPADFQTLPQRDLSDAACVVFDILRATSSMVTALANGAKGIIPVAEISDALQLRQKFPDALLAGERDGLRIGAALTGGVEFHLGNSPREYTEEVVSGKTITTTTTNGTRALRACAGAKKIFVASFLNLSATAHVVARFQASRIILVCAGTHERAALEDTLAAGATCDMLGKLLPDPRLTDSALIARSVFQRSSYNLAETLATAENAQRLLTIPELRDDVNFCLQQDAFPLVAIMEKDGVIRRAT